MATYLKNTYVDGSLTVEGELKVQNINVNDAQIAALTPDSNKRTINRITKFTSSSKQTIQNSVLDSTCYDLTNRTDYPFQASSIAAQITVKNEDELGDLPAHYDTLLQTRTEADNKGRLGSLAYTIGDYRLGEPETSYDPTETALIDNKAVLMIPVYALHLWNKTDSGYVTNSADNQWHFTEQPAAVTP